jgi:hypothetical protein
MAMNPLPPQAYTKDTLLRAYAWLQNQNLSIREMATTPDILVSLYLKTTRDGEEALDRPSIQNFKNELKSLAGLMGQLEKDHEKQKATPPPQPSYTQQGPSASRPDFGAYVGPAGASYSASEPIPPSQNPSPSSTLPGSFELLDPLSLQMLYEVKEGFNLSDQTEALRLLIKLGYLKARKILTE